MITPYKAALRTLQTRLQMRDSLLPADCAYAITALREAFGGGAVGSDAPPSTEADPKQQQKKPNPFVKVNAAADKQPDDKQSSDKQSADKSASDEQKPSFPPAADKQQQDDTSQQAPSKELPKQSPKEPLTPLQQQVTEDDQLSLSDGRIGTLEDLQRKADAAVASVNDPLIVQDLIQALQTYISDELQDTPENEPLEAPLGADGEPQPTVSTQDDSSELPTEEDGGPVDPTMPDKPKPGADSPHPEPDGDEINGKEPLDNPDEDQPAAAAPAAVAAPIKKPNPFAKKQVADTEEAMSDPTEQRRRVMGCEACGHQMEMMPMLASESDQHTASAANATPEEAHMHESKSAGADAAAPQTEPTSASALTEAERSASPETAPTVVQFTEADKAELMQLRAQVRKQKLIKEAGEAIKTAGVLVEAEELAAFPKEQWKTILSLADTPPRSYGTGASQLGPGLSGDASRRVRESAVDLFESRYGGGATE